MSVEFETQSGVALITLNHAPVNSLGLAVRKAIVYAVRRAEADSTVKAVVITGANGCFSAGADIEEFADEGGLAFRSPTLPEVIDVVERCKKPVVAAISGFCLGGGMELALGCHFRVAERVARFALPEVKLGLLPGAGGTQRLTRAIGMREALGIICTGEPLNAERAALLGLVILAEGDALGIAAAVALEAASRDERPSLRNREVSEEDRTDAEKIAKEQLSTLRHARLAHTACIKAVTAAVTLPFDEGAKVEFECFHELLESADSKALRYAFFSERTAGKIQSVPANAGIRPIDSVAVIGAGTMGAGIAMCCLNAGYPVVLVDRSRDVLDKAMATIRKTYDAGLKRGRLTEAVHKKRLEAIETTTNMAAIARVDLIIEAVFEQMDVKEAVFRTIDEHAKDGAILASNTSTLDVNRIAGFTRRAGDVIGLHFFSPAHVMKLLEVVRPSQTLPDVLATTMKFARKIGKVAVVSGVCDGFIGNRMVEEYCRQAFFLLDEGATPNQVDRALEQWGMAMGPFAMSDLAGNDITYAIRKRRAVEQPDRPYSNIPDVVCEMGRLGQKSGAGWYLYPAGSRKRVVDHEIESVISRLRDKTGVPRRDISDGEIVSRCLLALVNEGAKILEEGVAQRASDIDVVYLNGYGFPSVQGGPMFYANKLGIPEVVSQMERFQRGYQGKFWTPASLIAQLLKDKKDFNHA